MSDPSTEAILEDGSLDRAAVSPMTRFTLYVDDLTNWLADTLRWVGRGGDRPSLLPPSPRRVTRDYWAGEKSG